jgi:hypothetical protein
LLSFISCAVPEDQTLVADLNHLEFFGEIGLAPGWLDHPLSEKGKGWVGACMFARVSHTDVPIPLSFHDPSQALATIPDELTAVQSRIPLTRG